MQNLIEDLVRAVAADLPSDFQMAYERVELHSDGSGGTISLVGSSDPRADSLEPLPASPQHMARWRELWAAMAEGGGAFTTATLRLQANGEFDLNYGYEPIDGESALARQGRWLEELRQR